MPRDMEPAGRLAELETRIERGLETFVDVGLALLEIRDGRLYRESGYQRFEDYCRERWRFSDRRATQFIQAAEVSKILDSPPAVESQARELARLKEPEAIREVWHEVRQATPEPTARVIREAVERRLNPPQEYVCTECGEVHATRECPNCAEPEPRPMTVAQVPTLPGPPQLTREQRAYHQVFQLLSLFSLDPVAVAQAAPSIDSARRLLNELIGAEAWASQFVRELERQSSGGLRAIR